MRNLTATLCLTLAVLLRTLTPTVGFVLIIVSLSVESSAQGNDETAFARLIESQTITCDFNKSTVAEWRNGQLIVEDGGILGNPLIFDNINHDQGTARVVGNLGGVDVFVFATPTGVTFIESTNVGNSNFTTIYTDRLQSGRYMAVLSRHVWLLGPLPSQYYGSCQLLP